MSDWKEYNSHVLAFEIFAKLANNEFSYIYNGQFTTTISDHIIALGELTMEKMGKSSKVRKRVFSVVVESLQNVTRHHDDVGENQGFFAIQLINGSYYITTVNLIYNENIEKVDNILKRIQNANPEELKELYKETLSDNMFSNKGGAGLGLMEIAKKTNNKIYYNFHKVNDLYSYFYLRPYVSNTEQESEERNREHDVISLHELILKHQIHTIFSGLFDQPTLVNLLSITDNQMSSIGNNKRKIFSLMIEMLQNITKHGYSNDAEQGNPGTFFINTDKNQFILNSGNLILKSDVEKLKRRIEHVNSLDNQQLNNLYNEGLLNFHIDDNSSSGLGLIDLRIKSNNPLVFHFHSIDHVSSFFILEVTVDDN